MVHVCAGVLFATIGGIAITTRVARTAGGHTTTRRAGGGTMDIRAGIAARATVGCCVKRHLAAVRGGAVTIPVTCIAGTQLADRRAAYG